jgi:hypothetical protein
MRCLVAKASVRRQLEILNLILVATRSGIAKWEPTGAVPDDDAGAFAQPPGKYAAEWDNDSLLLERTDDGRVVLRFMTAGRPEWADEFVELDPTAQPTRDEDVRDGLLLKLMSEVIRRVPPAVEEDSVERIAAKLNLGLPKDESD